MLADDDYVELIALLEQRATALKPRSELIDSAIRRCERHQLANPSKTPEADAELADHDEENASASAASEADAQSSADAAADAMDKAQTEMSAEQTVELSVARTLEESRLSDEQLEQHRKVAEKHKKKTPNNKKRRLLTPGTEIQGYRILGLVGKGGMGQVYRAVQISMNREVAFKVLSPRYAQSKSFRTRFLREAHSAGRLHHRHLIAVHDVDETPEGMLFFSMEMVEGKSIADMIDDQGPLDEPEALRICKQTLEALAYAHDRGIIHRDIKPDNIILNSEGSVKVADLGLSRMDEEGDEENDGRVTAANTMMGTPYYMSPEQSRDAHNVDHRADLYSVGATLYHMICGEVPFDGETPLDVVVAASTEKLVFIDPQPSSGTKRFIQLLMAKEPDARPMNAHEALQILQRLEADPRASLSKTNSTKILVSVAIIVLIAMLIIVAAVSSAPRHAAVPDGFDESAPQSQHDDDSASAAPVVAAAEPVNLFEKFYYDIGEQPVHAADVSIFKDDGHGTVRFDALSGDQERTHFQIDILGRRPADRSMMVLQFMTSNNSRGQRGRLGIPGIMITSRGILFAHNELFAGRKSDRIGEHFSQRLAERMAERKDRDGGVTLLGSLANHMTIDVITDGKRVTIAVVGQEQDKVTIDLNDTIQSIDLRWSLKSELKGALTLNRKH